MLIIDSLNTELDGRKLQIIELDKEQKILKKRLQENRVSISGVENMLVETKNGYKRFFFIAAPSFLFLIMASVLIYFYLMMRQQEETERKISALKRYAHNEIEDTRSDLIKNVKRRIKKISKGRSGTAGKSKKSVKKK